CNVLQKPFTPQQIRQIAESVADRRTVKARYQALEAQLETAVPEIELESRSPRVRQLLGILAKAACSDVSVLFRGENGTGKSVLARYLHALSARAGRPMIEVN